MAELMHPGHPLMRTLIAQTMDDLQVRLKQGSVLVDPVPMTDWNRTCCSCWTTK